MNSRRFSVALPGPVAESLAAFAVRSGLRPGEVLAEALGAFEPFRHFAKHGGSVGDDPKMLWEFLDELEHTDDGTE